MLDRRTAGESKTTPAEAQALLKLLAKTPRHIASVSRGFDNSQLQLKPDKNSWSANDILAHLRACSDVWGKGIQAMLAEDNPTMRYVSPRAWIRKTNYPELEFRTSLQTYTRQRNELLKSLKTLAIKDWSRAATIDGRKQTVFSYARRIAEHETVHCEQIEALLKSQ